MSFAILSVFSIILWMHVAVADPKI